MDWFVSLSFMILGVGLLYFLKECATHLLTLRTDVRLLRHLVESIRYQERERSTPR